MNNTTTLLRNVYTDSPNDGLFNKRAEGNRLDASLVERGSGGWRPPHSLVAVCGGQYELPPPDRYSCQIQRVVETRASVWKNGRNVARSVWTYYWNLSLVISVGKHCGSTVYGGVSISQAPNGNSKYRELMEALGVTEVLDHREVDPHMLRGQRLLVHTRNCEGAWGTITAATVYERDPIAAPFEWDKPENRQEWFPFVAGVPRRLHDQIGASQTDENRSGVNR